MFSSSSGLFQDCGELRRTIILFEVSMNYKAQTKNTVWALTCRFPECLIAGHIYIVYCSAVAGVSPLTLLTRRGRPIVEPRELLVFSL